MRRLTLHSAETNTGVTDTSPLLAGNPRYADNGNRIK